MESQPTPVAEPSATVQATYFNRRYDVLSIVDPRLGVVYRRFVYKDRSRYNGDGTRRGSE